MYTEVVVHTILSMRDESKCTVLCRYAVTLAGTMLGELHTRRLSPSRILQERSINELLHSMKLVALPADGCFPGTCKNSTKCVGLTGKTILHKAVEALHGHAQKIESELGRACLECYRKDGGMAAKDCMHKPTVFQSR